ncbi:hypothetical protein FRC02_005782 [Tulasnella sp. 418]|nr:hypothetical protein FRC02_005782 [Tulasnella sp. 418]
MGNRWLVLSSDEPAPLFAGVPIHYSIRQLPYGNHIETPLFPSILHAEHGVIDDWERSIQPIFYGARLPTQTP